MSDKRGALSVVQFMSRNSDPLTSHSLWKLKSIDRLVGERPVRFTLPPLSGRKKARSRDKITEPAPKRKGAPFTMVYTDESKIINYINKCVNK